MRIGLQIQQQAFHKLLITNRLFLSCEGVFAVRQGRKAARKHKELARTDCSLGKLCGIESS
jgi:hypothetical protein